ncbi:undecaprenyl-diphosphatase [Singulisphaera sp. GP187]|uniref:phosphatase PAP2 family protein n=1 Tax=Singulisphaera sp. GP187 TaxID=1882752 RepID=UPI00092957CB|nr:phosphatase PAP2 family protein [Singulisphaera sp. GP187]SIN98456.1 undecaprenyl-diphosphatase [Singulisphaera sp. GP187]
MLDRGVGHFWNNSVRSRGLTWGVILLVLAGLACVVGTLGHPGRISAATDFDMIIHDWVVAHRGAWPTLTRLLRLATRFGDPPFAVTSTLMALCWVFSLHRRSIAGIRRSEVYVWLGTILGAWYLGMGLKLYFKRERPPILDRLVTEASYSFPSGHSVFAGAFYTTMAILLARVVPTTCPWLRRFAIVLCMFAAITIGWSRVWLGVHYPSDVLGGWLIGSTTALGVWLVRIGQAHRRPSSAEVQTVDARRDESGPPGVERTA